MPTSDSRDYELIDRLAEEFAERFRRGERPSVQEYCDRYPHLADDLREMLPALAEVEQVKDEVQAPPAEPAPKLRQVGEYHILREVGRGGMGVVYEAEDTRLARRVALKVLATGKAGHALERFKREARAAARLHHTNIVPVFGVGDHDGLPYYVMQFIQGLGLDEVLDEVKRLQAKSGSAVMPSAVRSRPRKDISAVAVARSLITGTFEPPANGQLAETLTHAPVVGTGLRTCADPAGSETCRHDSAGSSISLPGQSTLSGRKLSYWQSVAQIGLQVADALDYAHKQGILHRDIKPSNLLLDLHGVVWVTDFGLAKAADQEDLTHTGDVLGTLRYMPPEAFEGKSEARSDVYSLGLTMYELLALRPAYDERKKEQLVKQVTTTDPARLESLNRAIPRDLETIVHKAIEKDPDHRYKSAADLAADLRRFLADLTILARRVSPTERFARWCKRNPTVAALSSAVFALLAAVAIVSTLMALRIERKEKETRFEADRANQEANDKQVALDRAEKDRQRTEELLGEQFVHRGAVMLAEGDVGGAALCFAQALKLDPANEDRALTHRIRVTAALREAARPHNILFHDSPIVCSAISPDGELFAAGCEDKSVYVWHVATGRRLGPVLHHEHELQSVAFAAGGKRIWTQTRHLEQAAADGLYDDEWGAWEGPGGGFTRQRPAITVHLWDREEARIVLAAKTRGALAALDVIDPVTNKGWMCYQPAPNVVETLDRDTGKRIGPPIELPGTGGSVVAASPAQNRVVAYGTEVPKKTGRDGTTDRRYVHHVYDVRSGKHVFRTPPSGTATAALCGTNDRFLLKSESDTGAVQWYELATGDPGPRLEQPGMNANVYAPSPDHRRLFATFTPRGQTNRQAAPYHMLDADTGKQIGEPFEEYPTTAPGGFSPRLTLTPNLDATRILVTNGTQRPKLQDGSGKTIAENLEGSTGLLAVFSRDGGFLLTVGADNTARVWDAWTGRPFTPRLPHDGPVKVAGFTPDGSHVFVISGTAAWFWPLARADQGRGLVLANTSDSRILSADGSRVLEWPATALGGTTTARVLDSSTGQVVAGPVDLSPWRKDVPGGPLNAVLRPDGRAALFSIRGRVKGPDLGPGAGPGLTVIHWNCETGVAKKVADFGPGPLASLQFSPDGRFIQVGVPEPKGGSLHQLWDAATVEPIGPGITVAAPKEVSGFIPKGGFGGGFGSFAAFLTRAAWSPDSSILACDNGDRTSLDLFNPRTGEKLSGGIPCDPGRTVVKAFSRDSSRLLISEHVTRGFGGSKGGPAPGPETLSGRVRLVETRTGKLIGTPLIGSRWAGMIVGSSLNPAGDRVAVVIAPTLASILARSAGDANGLGVYVWDPAAGRLAAPPLIHDRPVTDLSFSPDGQWLLTTTDRHVRLWSVGTGELLHTLPATERITSADFAGDGKRIVVSMNEQLSAGFGGPGGRPLGRAPRGLATSQQVWDVRTGQPLTPALPVNGGGLGRRGSGVFAAGLGIGLPAQGPSTNAEKLLITRDDGTPEVYSLVSDDRPMTELMNLAELLSTRQVNSAGVVQGLGPAGYRSAWDANRPKLAAEWSARSAEGSDWDRLCLPLRRLASVPSTSLLQLQNSLAGERAGQYLWHLDRLLRAEPDDPELHALRGLCLNVRGEYAEAERAFTQAIALKSQRSAELARAHVRSELGQWKEAEADVVAYLKAQEDNAVPSASVDSADARVLLALIQLKRNDLKGYEASARNILNLATSVQNRGPTAPPDLWAALLRDGALEDIEELYPNASDLSRGSMGSVVPVNWQTALRYRQGRYEEVPKTSPGGGLYDRARTDRYFIAMAQYKLGKTDEARTTLENARNLDTQPLPRGSGGFGGSFLDLGGVGAARAPSPWMTKLVEETLRQEAEALILGKK